MASNIYAVVLGGLDNSASGPYSMVSAGFDNCAGAQASWAGGWSAKVRPGTLSGVPGAGCDGVVAVGFGGDSGTYVWSGSQTDFVSTGSGQYLIDAPGGVGIQTNSPNGFALAVNGSAAKPGGGSWSVFSDRRLKRNIQTVSNGMLGRLLQMKTYTFDYIDEAVENGLGLTGTQVGLMAQEVAEVFPDWVDQDDRGYLYVTERSVMAIMVQALRELRSEKDAQLEALAAQNAELHQRLLTLEAMLASDERG